MLQIYECFNNTDDKYRATYLERIMIFSIHVWNIVTEWDTLDTYLEKHIWPLILNKLTVVNVAIFLLEHWYSRLCINKCIYLYIYKIYKRMTVVIRKTYAPVELQSITFSM